MEVKADDDLAAAAAKAAGGRPVYFREMIVLSKIGTTTKFWEHQATTIEINFMQDNPIY